MRLCSSAMSEKSGMSICKSWCLHFASFIAYSLSANLTPFERILIAVLGSSFLIWFIKTNKLSPIRVGSPPVIPISWVLLSNREINFKLNGVLSFSCNIGGCGHIMQRWLHLSVAIIALWLDLISYTKTISPRLLMTTASPSLNPSILLTTQ